MNIQTAIGYLKHGYRVRRSIWYRCEYLCSSHNEVLMKMTSVMHPRSIEHQKFEWIPRVGDVAADDWELITDGIKSDTSTIEYSS